jgi:hypothetical protein
MTLTALNRAEQVVERRTEEKRINVRHNHPINHLFIPMNLHLEFIFQNLYRFHTKSIIDNLIWPLYPVMAQITFAVGGNFAATI